MPDNTKMLIRNAREQDIPTVAEIDAQAVSLHGSADTAETFQLRLTTFPDGFIILVAENEIAAYGCTEKWLTERGLSENLMPTHQPDGRILCITAMAVNTKFQGRGYGLLMLDKLIEIAHREGCRKIVLETTQAQGLFLKRGFKSNQQRSEHGRLLDAMSLEIESYGSKA